MKILLANKFYYRRGGDCIYMLNLEQMLRAHGQEGGDSTSLPAGWIAWCHGGVLRGKEVEQ